MKQEIKDFYGRIIGYIETDVNTGKKTATDFYGRILGYYKKDLDITTDFYGRTLARGDVLSGLIFKEIGK